MSKISQYLLDRFSRFFSPNGMYLHEFSRSGPVFPIPQRTLPLQPIKVEKSTFLRANLFWRASTQKRIAISQFRVPNVRYYEFLYIVYNLGDIWSRNLEFTLLTIAPFVAILQKSAYHAKYLRMS